MPFSSINGTSIRYDVAGAGPPVCLINGYRLSSEAWPTVFLSRLATRGTVVTFENRGTGLRGKPDDGYEIGNMARDVIGVFDTVNLHRVHVFGFSMGGAIAQEVAIRFPGRVG